MNPKLFWISIPLMIMGIVLIGVIFRSDAVMLSFMGSLLGGAISGVLTMYGVIATINWSRNQDNRMQHAQRERDEKAQSSKRNRQHNQVRLLLSEMNHNRNILRILSHEPTKMSRLQDHIWMKLQTELDWLDHQTFTELFDLYTGLGEVREYVSERLQSGTSLELNESDHKHCHALVKTIEQIRGDLIVDFPSLEDVLPCAL